MAFAFEELKVLAERQLSWEASNVSPSEQVFSVVDEVVPGLSSEEIGCLVQGMRLELDVLDRDWDLIVGDWF